MNAGLMYVTINSVTASVSLILWAGIAINALPITGDSNRVRDVVTATVKLGPSEQNVTIRQDSADADQA